MRSISLLFSLLLFTLQGMAQQASKVRPFVISYYSGTAERLDSFDVRQMTHLIYCFGHVQGNRFHLSSRKDTLLIQKMVSLKKKNTQLKVLLSLGGWGGCAPCSDVFGTDAGRKAFARSVKEMNSYLKTDGIDLDWEYPAIEGYPGHTFKPEDRNNFTELVKDLRRELGANATITFAAGGFQKFLDESVDWQAVMPLVSFVNMMTYDLVSGFSTVTGHHTPLYSTTENKESADHAIQYLLGKGVPASKIVLGAAFYARVWENVADVNNGLYQSGKFKAFVPYRTFGKELAGYTTYWDSTAKAPYAYNRDQKLYATFDDKRSIALKTRYVQEHNLGGIMYWELGLDEYRNGLLQTINENLK
ncbi:chitinase [Cnuella takakiae]|uniref:chitinase n=1 Tax=Cnuella takakiae TaxID=1302690 RepID=A0A1M5BNE8_9BACT|nr:glycoside hydrolase family 18 protein [Cnuella takakiae]OLY93451.1 glycoside hydrolase [Cnuella takakiae]SHF43905.1 chitinase [Cnuella takakiae]